MLRKIYRQSRENIWWRVFFHKKIQTAGCFTVKRTPWLGISQIFSKHPSWRAPENDCFWILKIRKSFQAGASVEYRPFQYLATNTDIEIVEYCLKCVRIAQNIMVDKYLTEYLVLFSFKFNKFKLTLSSELYYLNEKKFFFNLIEIKNFKLLKAWHE